MYLLGAVDLLLLDEIHHIGEERGSTLEALVVRMRILNSAYINAAEKRSNGIPCRTRVVALSATLPNISEIGEWLQCSPEATHYFDESFRPVPLTVHVAAYSNCRNPFLFEKNLDSKVLDIIQRFSDGRQTLIFCSSKKGTEALCSHLSKFMKLPFLENRLIAAIVDPTLRYLARSGFGYHHAGTSLVKCLSSARFNACQMSCIKKDYVLKTARSLKSSSWPGAFKCFAPRQHWLME